MQKKLKMLNFLHKELFILILIESKSVTGSQTSKIKSHHNVGGLTQKNEIKIS